MKTGFKKSLAALMAMLMIFSIVSITASAATTYSVSYKPGTYAKETAEYVLDGIEKNETITLRGETYTREEYGTTSYGLEAGATYRVRAMSGSSEVRSSAYSNSVTFSVKLANPLFKSATADMIRWQSGDSYTQGYYYKIGENGEVQYTNRPTLYFKDLTVNSGDIIYVQAYADGCESSDWVLLYTVTA